MIAFLNSVQGKGLLVLMDESDVNDATTVPDDTIERIMLLEYELETAEAYMAAYEEAGLAPLFLV